MIFTRGLAVALLILAGCDPTSAPSGQPEPSSASDGPAPLMQRAVMPSDEPLTAEPRFEQAAPTPSEPAIAYDRKAWPHWIDADHDCQDTRTEVLIAENYGPIGFEDDRTCEVAEGRWQCPYTGELIREVHLLDVDHLVPLANAHRSGAATWTKEQRRRYANDLEHAEQLVAVGYAANRSKGDKGPEAWLPTSEDYRCTYVRDWVTVKQRWQLGMNVAEAKAVREALAACKAGRIPELPQTQPKPKPKPNKTAAGPREAKQVKHTEHDARECCRTCKKGKACGDSCIAQASNCTKPPGCACDG